MLELYVDKGCFVNAIVFTFADVLYNQYRIFNKALWVLKH